MLKAVLRGCLFASKSPASSGAWIDKEFDYLD